MRDCGRLSLKWDISITSIPSTAQTYCENAAGKDVKATSSRRQQGNSVWGTNQGKLHMWMNSQQLNCTRPGMLK